MPLSLCILCALPPHMPAGLLPCAPAPCPCTLTHCNVACSPTHKPLCGGCAYVLCECALSQAPGDLSVCYPALHSNPCNIYICTLEVLVAESASERSAPEQNQYFGSDSVTILCSPALCNPAACCSCCVLLCVLPTRHLVVLCAFPCARWPSTPRHQLDERPRCLFVLNGSL